MIDTVFINEPDELVLHNSRNADQWVRAETQSTDGGVRIDSFMSEHEALTPACLHCLVYWLLGVTAPNKET